MDVRFDFITNLQYKVRALTAQLKALESGEKFVTLKSEFRSQLSAKDREIRTLKLELTDAHCQTATVRKNWMQVIEDMEKEHGKALQKKDRTIQSLEERALRAEQLLDEHRSKLRDKNKELYQTKVELEDEKGKVLKLKAQINRDYENSSNPSSLKPNRKKITNNREKTGRTPGGQFGHKGHPRKRHVPTDSIDIPVPEEYVNNPEYKPTGKVVSKQLISIHLGVTVTEYSTPEFRYVRTGQRVHAKFPEGLVNEVNYSGNVKAFMFLLNNRCNVSIKNASGFLSEMTGGKLNISAGMINGLSKEFSRKTEQERKKAFADILLSPVVNMDFTSARVSGRKMNVAVCATPSTVLYFARNHKGHKGIQGTPVETYQGTLVHDHDKTFYNYGNAHQECLDHPLRYLKDSMENEPNLKWNKLMRELIREMIHFRNGLDPNDDRNPDQIEPDIVVKFEARYNEILGLAKEEYEYEPPSKYYIDGFNLYMKLANYKDNHLLFLHDRRVPHNNNLSERLLRVIKRKQAQAMTFRSDGGLDFLCHSLGIIASLRVQGKNLFECIASIF